MGWSQSSDTITEYRLSVRVTDRIRLSTYTHRKSKLGVFSAGSPIRLHNSDTHQNSNRSNRVVSVASESSGIHAEQHADCSITRK